MREQLRILILLTFAVATAGCGTSPEAPAPREPAPPAVGREVPADSRPLIVAFGDSLTAGLGVDPAASYPSQLQARIDAAGLRYRVVNAGVSGETSAQGLNRLPAIREMRPEIVILELGANDGLRGLPLESTRRNLDAIIAGLKSDGVRVVLAGMEMPPNYGPDYTRGFREIFRSLAREHNVRLIPFFLEGVGGRAELNQSDGIHPTADGYAVVVENVWKALGPMLAKPAD